MNPEITNLLCELHSPQLMSVEPFVLKRKLDKTSRVKPSMLFYSQKNLSMQYAESLTELHSQLTLEFDETVKVYLSQPATFYICIDGKTVPHTPDIMVVLVSGEVVFIQVKPASVAFSGKYKAKFEQMETFFEQELGTTYLLFTEQRFNQGKYIENLQMLYPFLSPAPEETHRNVIRDVSNPMTIEELETMCIEAGYSKANAWSLIANGHFEYDNTAILTTQSTITPTNKE